MANAQTKDQVAEIAAEIAARFENIQAAKDATAMDGKNVKAERMDTENEIYDLLVNSGNVDQMFQTVYRILDVDRIVMTKVEDNVVPVKVEGKNGAPSATLKQYASACRAVEKEYGGIDGFTSKTSKDGTIQRSALGSVHDHYKNELNKSDDEKAFEDAMKKIKKAFTENKKAGNDSTNSELLKKVMVLSMQYGDNS